MKLKPEISIVLPCYNEAKNIPLIVERLSKFWPKVNFELILVDNGSTDNSADVLLAESSKHVFVKVVSIKTNMGYGHGIFKGLKAAQAPILSYSHADIQTPPEDLFKAFFLLKEQQLDIEKVLIKGLRINRREKDLFLTKALAKVVEIILGYKMDDINGQPKMFSKRLLADLIAAPEDFSFDVYVMYVAQMKGLKLITFPVDFGQRIHGESKWATSSLRKIRTILKYLMNIFKIARAHFEEPKNLLKQGVRFLCAGVLTNAVNYGLFFLMLHLWHAHYSVSSVSGFLAGFVTGFFVNRSWTFSISSGQRRYHLIRFTLLNFFSLGANLLTITLLTEQCKVIPEISQIIAIGVSTVINFIGSKFWVFKG